MSALRISIIDNLSNLEKLEERWENLRLKSNTASMCLSWSWITIWCRHYLTKRDQIHTLLCFNGEELVAICPFYLKGIFLGKELRFLGTGEAESIEVASEFQDLIVLPGYEKAVLSSLSDYINNNVKITAMSFDVVLADSLVAQWLENCTLKSHQLSKTNVGHRFMMPILKDCNSQIAEFRSKTTRRQAKHVIKSEIMTYDIAQNYEDVESTFQTLISLHNNAWKKKGEKGAFEEKVFTNFHREFSQDMFKKNKLLLFRLQLKQQTNAVFYGIIDNNILYYYQSGIEYSAAVPSVGTAMHLTATNIAREKQIPAYDLMNGKHLSYKEKYLKSDKFCFSYILITNPIIYLLGKLKFKLQSAFNRIQQN